MIRPDSEETNTLLDRLRQGEAQALSELFDRHREGLRTFVELRLDARLSARFDPSDVVQETQLALAGRMDDFLERRPMPFRLWLRKKAQEMMINLRRDHVEAEKRSVRREEPQPDRSSLLLARP